MYKFTYGDKTYELNEEKIVEFINDEEKPVIGIDAAGILELLNQKDNVEFEVEHYNRACQTCFAGKEEKAKSFTFLVYSFYLYTKKRHYVMSTISKEYEGNSYSKLLNDGTVDDSYSINVIVCDNCGEFEIEIFQCDI